ncbi:MAG: hypothetical protein Q8N81_08385 [bacterium]|nr:hypothetical protein [bacterium]
MDQGLKEIFDELGDVDISWWKKLLLKFWPKLAFRFFASELGIANPVFEQLQEIFTKVKRVDVFPLTSSGSRGFMLVLGQKASLWFYQDGDHFVYDGFEMGEYEKGDVTIFDHLRN